MGKVGPVGLHEVGERWRIRTLANHNIVEELRRADPSIILACQREGLQVLPGKHLSDAGENRVGKLAQREDLLLL